jgi:hypothetical protein
VRKPYGALLQARGLLRLRFQSDRSIVQIAVP